MERMGDRRKWCRRECGRAERELVTVSGVGLATIRRIEQDEFKPRLDTVRRLPETLHTREGSLAFGESPMLGLNNMTGDEQMRMHAGPGTAGLPGFVIVEGSAWYRDEDGNWKVDRTRLGQREEADGQ